MSHIEKAKNIGLSIIKNDRILYWEQLLGNEIDVLDEKWNEMLNDSSLGEAPQYTVEDIDSYIENKYSDILKKPEIMAKILKG